MTQKDFNFERDLSDAFAPVHMPETLQQRLLQIPQLQVQRSTDRAVRFLPRSWWLWLTAISSRPVFGMTTSVAAACCSLVIGLGLGMGGLMPQTVAVQNSTQATTVAVSTTSSDTDAVSLLYAAADLQGDLP